MRDAYPIDELEPPREHIHSFMHSKYEGRVMWVCRTPFRGSNSFGIMQKCWVQAPKTWDIEQEEIKPWKYGSPIVVARPIVEHIKIGMAKLEHIYNMRSEEQNIGKIAYSIPCGEAIGPYSTMVLRFYVLRHKDYYGYRAQTFRCVHKDDNDFEYRHNRHCFAWREESCEQVFDGFKAMIARLEPYWLDEDQNGRVEGRNENRIHPGEHQTDTTPDLTEMFNDPEDYIA
jgi:hypothetical protein